MPEPKTSQEPLSATSDQDNQRFEGQHFLEANTCTADEEMLCSSIRINGKDTDRSPRSLGSRNTAPSRLGQIKTLWKAGLRALGLPIFIHALESLRHPMGRGFQEPKKKAVQQDRSFAMARALIHLIPVSVALCEIVLNWNTYYVGTSPYPQATYQFLAKVHELMIQASLTAIVFSCIRNEMVFSGGIPFGLIFSGLQISQVSYLWSMEFWGSLRSGYYRSCRKLLVLLFIPLCILLASVCGPSSAVLLVPRTQFWPGGSTDIWINATYNDLWPNK